MSDWTIFGERLSHIMRVNGVPLRELERRTGITLTTLHRYATCKRVPRATEILKCADALGVTCDYLLGLSDDPHLTGKGGKKKMAEVKRKMDLRTAEYITDKARNDPSVFPIEFCECEKCGADYIEKLGHDCNRVVELTWHTKEGDFDE